MSPPTRSLIVHDSQRFDRRRPSLLLAVCLLPFLILIAQVQTAYAMDGLRWTWIDPLPTGTALYRIIYANQQFVAVGEAETILTSPDGRDWTVQRSGIANETFDLVDVAWGNDRYVALGRYKETKIDPSGQSGTVIESILPITSPDGYSWTVHYERKGFAEGNHRTSRLDDTSTAQLAFDGRQFVLRVKPRVESPYFMLSPNGLEWSRDDRYQPTDFPRFHPTAPGQFARGNGTFVAVTPGLAHSPTVYTSEDGQTWTDRLSRPPFFDIAFGNGLFVGVGVATGGERQGYIMTSSDGLNWTEQGSHLSQPKERTYRAAASAKGVTVVGGQGKIVLLDASLRPTIIPMERDIFDIAYIDGRFVAVGMQERQNACGDGAIYTSPDGRDWTVQWSEWTACPTKIIQTDHRTFVLSRQTLISSQDLTEWELRPMKLPKNRTVRDITWGAGRFLLLSSDRLVYTSTDGETWTTQDPHLDDDLRHISFAKDLFVISGDKNIYVSTDGNTWGIRKISTYSAPPPVRRLYYVDGQYVGVGGSSLIFSSTGKDWRVDPANREVQFHDIVSSGSHLILVGANRILAARLPACRAYFFDLPESHSACKAAELLYQHRVIAGYENHTFRPQSQVTRAEVAKMIVVATNQYPNPTGRVSFKDVTGHWSVTQGYLQASVESGIISGFTPERFGPNEPLTRAQLIKITAAALGLKEGGTPSHSGVPTWANGWVAAAQQAKLIGNQAPYPIWTDGNLDGDKPVTRAEAAVLLANLMSLKK